jgi:hypothetical protein
MITPIDRVVDLLRRGHTTARGIDAQHHGADAFVFGQTIESSHRIARILDHALHRHDRDRVLGEQGDALVFEVGVRRDA